jgi:DNA (cytosine-5)-methyltransferase 1
MTYRLLDLFCGAGGAGMGYHRAGFDVTGVDIKPMPRYPFTFIHGDALEYLTAHGHEYDVIHASPPCQGYSRLSAMRPELKTKYPMLVGAVRDLLVATGRPFVIENVPGAPLLNPTLLCGLMFGLKLYRHRLFETGGFDIELRMHPAHHRNVIAVGRRSTDPEDIMTVAGHMSSIGQCKTAMGIDWMTRDELAEAIPPAYTEFIGAQLMMHMERRDK